jgi:hypothetical protein
VTPAGEVYAVDIDAEILDYLKQQLRKQNLANVICRHFKPDDPCCRRIQWILRSSQTPPTTSITGSICIAN